MAASLAAADASADAAAGQLAPGDDAPS